MDMHVWSPFTIIIWVMESDFNWKIIWHKYHVSRIAWDLIAKSEILIHKEEQQSRADTNSQIWEHNSHVLTADLILHIFIALLVMIYLKI